VLVNKEIICYNPRQYDIYRMSLARNKNKSNLRSSIKFNK